MDSGKAYWANRHLDELRRLVMSDVGAKMLGSRRRKDGCKKFAEAIDDIKGKLAKMFEGDREFSKDERLNNPEEVLFHEDALNLVESVIACLRMDVDRDYTEEILPALEKIRTYMQDMLNYWKTEELRLRKIRRLFELATRSAEEPKYTAEECERVVR